MLCVIGSHFSFTCSKSSVGIEYQIYLMVGGGGVWLVVRKISAAINPQSPWPQYIWNWRPGWRDCKKSVVSLIHFAFLLLSFLAKWFFRGWCNSWRESDKYCFFLQTLWAWSPAVQILWPSDVWLWLQRLHGWYFSKLLEKFLMEILCWRSVNLGCSHIIFCLLDYRCLWKSSFS